MMETLSRRNDFIVTLPSNASMKLYPTNKPGDYKTKLATLLDLESAGGDWEVALVDIQMPHSWYNFREAAIVVAALEPNDRKLLTGASTVVSTDGSSGASKDFLEAVNALTTEKYLVAKVVVEAGYYLSPEAIAQRIVAQLNAVLKKSDVSIDYDENVVLRRFSLSTKEVSLRFFTNGPNLMNNLGFGGAPAPRKHGQLVTEYDVYTKEPGAHVFDLERQGGFDRDFSVYVYTDIVKNQLVGDTMAPLLGVVPVDPKSKPDTLLYWGFNPPYYLPLRLMRFDTIHIALCTDTGKELEFRRDDDKVTCRLHFKCRSSI